MKIRNYDDPARSTVIGTQTTNANESNAFDATFDLNGSASFGQETLSEGLRDFRLAA